MASADVGDELLCSICLSIFTDPVTLRCGHNFCRVCIDEFLNTQDGSGVYSCPDCRAVFLERPPLQRNVTLHNVAERFLSTHPHREEITGIRCTYCIHSPVPAVKSCLHCEASLCDNHLRVHSKSAEHVLTEPSTNLGDRKCSVHKKILEYYCTEDAACICVYCSAGEHWGHQVEMLDEASENKKKKLRNVLQKLITKREKTEERVQTLEERWRKAQEKAFGEIERATALFRDIRRRLDHLEKKVLSEISRKEEQMSLSLSDVIQKLEVKKDELSRKMRHIEELCNMTDPLTVLQEPDTGDLWDPEEEGSDAAKGEHDGGHEATGGHDGGHEATGICDGGNEATGGHDGGPEATGGHVGGQVATGGHDESHDADVGVIARMLIAGISDIMTYVLTILPTESTERQPQPHSIRSPPRHTLELSVSDTEYCADDVAVKLAGIWEKIMVAGERWIYGRGPADILLDVNTAGNYILISNDQKTATWKSEKQNHPEGAERFEDNQVMSSNRFTSGRHYWDVEVSRSGDWRIGMCYPSLDRKGRQSYIGYNNKSWSLCRGLWCHENNKYSVVHDSKVIPIPRQISSDRFRICVDYEPGRLYFYELCDPIRHLHTFTATFTEPLHVAFRVWSGWVNISKK